MGCIVKRFLKSRGSPDPRSFTLSQIVDVVQGGCKDINAVRVAPRPLPPRSISSFESDSSVALRTHIFTTGDARSFFLTEVSVHYTSVICQRDGRTFVDIELNQFLRHIVRRRKFQPYIVYLTFESDSPITWLNSVPRSNADHFPGGVFESDAGRPRWVEYWCSCWH